MKSILLQSDARRLPLADGSIHTCINSPPYWGLRDYGLEASVWGGEAGCDHEFIDEHVDREMRRGINRANSPACTRGGAKKVATIPHFQFTHGSCSKCGAWRGCLGLEPTPELFVAHLVEVYREVRRVLRDDGTLFVNIGDSYATGAGKAGSSPGGGPQGDLWMMRGEFYGGRYAGGGIGPCQQPNRMPIPGLKPKDRVGIPHLLVFALRADGWYWRDEIVWHKPNPMPESVTDRTTKAHEFIFVLSKSERYFYDADAIREPVTSTGGASFGKQNHSADGTGAQSRALADPAERNHPLGRNKRSVWTIATQSYHGAHFATFPTKLVEPCIKAGSSEKGCCRECGAPWKRVVERVPTGKTQKMADGWDTGEGGHTSFHRQGREKGKADVPVMANVTIAWTPTCKCHAGEPVPCRVLDPFCGSGTTVAVALQLGRVGVGTDLKADYLKLARERVAAAASAKPLRPRRVRESAGEPTLFATEASR